MNLNVNEREPEALSAAEIAEEQAAVSETQPENRAAELAQEPDADRNSHRTHNLINLLFGAAAFALYLYAMAVFFAGAGTVNGLGFGASTPSVATVEAYLALITQGIDLSVAVPLYYYAILLVAYLVIAVILIVNLIRAFICLLGLVRLGNDSLQSEKRFHKLNNLVFGGVGSVIAFAVLCSLSGDELSPGAVVFLAIAGAVYGLMLVLHAVRNQIARKERGWLRFALDLARDLLMSGLAVICVLLLTGAPIRDAAVALAMTFDVGGLSALVAQIVRMVVSLFRISLMLSALSVLKKTLKFYVFNSAKRKDVNDILIKKYIALLAMTLVFWLIGSVCSTCLVFADNRIFGFDASMFATWLGMLREDYLPVLLAALAGVLLVSYVGGDERRGAVSVSRG